MSEVLVEKLMPLYDINVLPPSSVTVFQARFNAEKSEFEFRHDFTCAASAGYLCIFSESWRR